MGRSGAPRDRDFDGQVLPLEKWTDRAVVPSRVLPVIRKELIKLSSVRCFTKGIGMYSVRLDDDRGIILGFASGFWTVAEAKGYINDYRSRILLARARYRKVRILVDVREAAVQSREVAEHLMAFKLMLKNDTDRMAAVVASSLKKQQAVRIMPSCGMAFLSMNAAETWLLAHDGVPSASAVEPNGGMGSPSHTPTRAFDPVHT